MIETLESCVAPGHISTIHPYSCVQPVAVHRNLDYTNMPVLYHTCVVTPFNHRKNRSNAIMFRICVTRNETHTLPKVVRVESCLYTNRGWILVLRDIRKMT